MSRISLRTPLLNLLPLSLVLVTASPIPCQQPVPGLNVNMVSGTSWPGGDPFAQRQNEPSGAASTMNKLHLLVASNDYSAVDIPTVLGSNETGDAWLGLFKSFDGGMTWRKTVLAGCPYNITECADPKGTPLKGFHAAADPTVRSNINGLFHLNGIVFNRGTNAPGALFVATFHDSNNMENGDSISLQWVTVVDTGNSGQFLDKPWIEVDIPRIGAGNCTVPGYNFDPVSRKEMPFDVGNVYLVYSKFVGSDLNNPHSQIMFAKSSNGGRTWTKPVKLSESNSVNQGTTMAVAPNGDIYIVWRRIQNPSASESNAIMFVRSSNQGSTFTKAAVAAEINPFDQGTSGVSFRTRAFPTIAVDGNNVAYLAWSERGLGPNGEARVLMKTLAPDDKSWSSAFAVDSPTDSTFSGHQFMPALSVAAGKLLLLYYEHREDNTVGVFTPKGGGVYEEERVLASKLRTPPLPDDPRTVFNAEGIQDVASLHRRHTLDVRVAQANLDQPTSGRLFGQSVRVSSYKFGTRPDAGPRLEQLQFNPPNFTMFNDGQWPFIGDYIDLFPNERFVRRNGGWKFNLYSSDSEEPLASPVFHALWTDNRNVRPPIDGDWSNYVPPIVLTDCTTPPCLPFGCTSTPCRSFYDPTRDRTLCSDADTGRTGMRNQDIYTARIPQGLVAGSLGNTKPLGRGSRLDPIQRGHVIFVQNNQNKQATYTLTISAPSGVTASFLQSPPESPIPGVSYPLTTLTLDVAPRSTVARTVFIIATARGTKYVPVTVEVREVTSQNPLKATVVLNADIANADIVNVDKTNADIANVEIYNADIVNADIANADIANALIVNRTISADIANADIVNADIANADIANADIVNADIVNADIANAGIAYADIANADIANADIANADIVNADIANKSFTDVTWSIKNSGNTAAAYNIKLLLKTAQNLNDAKLQLLLYRTYTNPVTLMIQSKPTCNLKEQVQNQLVASVPSPVLLTNPEDLALKPENITDPQVTNATMALPPGASGKITLRISGVPQSQMWELLDSLRAAATAQGRNTDGSSQSAPLALVITTYELNPTTYPLATSTQLGYRGGTGRPVTWSEVPPLPSGDRPGLDALGPLGLSITTGGLISGAPKKAGAFKFRVKVSEDPNSSGKTPPQMDIGIVTLIVSKAAATVTLSNLETVYTGSPLSPSAATSPAGLKVLWTGDGQLTPGNTYEKTNVGSYSVTAMIDDNNYQGKEIGIFRIARGSQTITFGTLADKTYGDAPFTVSASASSGLQVTFSASGNCTVSGTTVTIAGAGSCTITASQGGNSNYNPAAPVTQQFAIAKASQTITFGALADKTYGDAPFTVSASASSGLQATFSASGNCTVSGTTVTITGAGSCTITAGQGGNSNYNPAAPVTQQFAIALKYTFFGFLSPMAKAGTVQNPSCSGVANLGSNVTLKWQLRDGSGQYVNSLAAVDRITLAQNSSCSGPSSSNTTELYPITRGGTVLRYSPTDNQFVLNWDTAGLTAGYYNIVIYLRDVSEGYSTIIRLK